MRADGRLEDADIAIIGGGVIGCAIAYYLSKGGADVTLLEAGALNREASGANAGSLHLQMYAHPTFPPDWLDQTRPSAPLLREAAVMWASIEDELETDCGVRLGGGIWVAESGADMEMLESRVRVENEVGITSELLARAELLGKAPYLGPDVVGGSFLRGEGFADPLLVTDAYMASAKRAGARFITGARVVAIESRSGGFSLATSKGLQQASQVVVAAGAWTPHVTKLVDLHLPTVADVVQVHVTESRPGVMRDQLVQHVSRGLSLKQTPRGAFIIGGGWPGRYERSSGRKVVELESMIGNAWVALKTVPAVGEARIVRSWAGIGARTTDELPIIGASDRVPGLHVAFASLGFTMGPIVARLLAEQMLGGHPRMSIDAFAPDRF